MGHIMIFTYSIARMLSVFLIFLLAGCILPVRSPGPLIYIPPDPGAEPISITVVRASQFIGYYAIHYVALDGRYVASLETGQYMKIPISKGQHELTVTLDIGLGTRHPVVRTAEVDFECCDDNACLFGIRTRSSWFQDLPPEIIHINSLDGEFSLEGKTFVKPGLAEK